MPQHLRSSSALCSLLSARSPALGRMLLSLARRAMDEVLTKISLLLLLLPRSSAIILLLLEMEKGPQDRTTSAAAECISHDESITAVNLTALRSLIPRLHGRGKRRKGYLYSNGFSCGKASSSRCHIDLQNLEKTLEVHFSNLAPRPISKLLISIEREILNECSRGPHEFSRDPLMLNRVTRSVRVNFL